MRQLLVVVSLFLAAPAVAQEVTPPSVLTRVDAVYPADAIAEGLAGTSVLQVTVRADGTVGDTNVVSSAGPVLDGAAITAVLQWTFSPAMQGEQAIAARIQIPFVFEAPPAEPVPVPVIAEEPAIAEEEVLDVTVRGQQRAPSRGASDYQFEIGALKAVPRANAAEILKLAPGILLTNEGGEGHAEQVFLRGFDAREGQDIEFTVDGTPINESGNLHGNGYSDTHFIIPELVESLRVIEGPFDPRQGNYAVAGSADYHLGLVQRGLTVKGSAGSFGTFRELVMYGAPSAGAGNFVAVDLYQTRGYGANRNGQRGSITAQVEGRVFDASTYRLTATAYTASFHTAGVIRDDDYREGRIGFYGTYDPLQGEDASRYSLSGSIETHDKDFTAKNQVFLIFRPLRIRENLTGYLLDVQQPLQRLHGQRGDLLDLHNTGWTFGARGNIRTSREIFGLMQELEVGYFARGDSVSSQQQRVEAATRHPYRTETDLDALLGNVGLYVDASIRPARFVVVRGGVRGDLFTFDINDKCAVQSVENPSPSNPPGDASCLSQQIFGAYREPNQRAGTFSTAVMPRGSVLVGPFYGLSATASIGRGIRSIDPVYITQDAKTPFARVMAYEGGLTYEHDFGAARMTASSVVFATSVDRDLIFSQTAGRNVLSQGTKRIGSANALRIGNELFDVAANATYVNATYDETGDLIPYVPDLVLRADGSVHTTRGDWHGALSSGVSYVGRRPLPFDERSNVIFTVDGNAQIGWRWVDFGVSAQNLFDRRYRLGEYNYTSDFRSQSYPTLVPVRHFAAGAPRTVLFSLTLHYGGEP